MPTAEITLRAELATLGVRDAGADAMIYACAAAYPAEACGFVLHGGEVVVLVNQASATRFGYVIAPEDVALYGERIMAVFHSHPDGVATMSARDRELMQDGWRYIVIATCGPVVSGATII